MRDELIKEMMKNPYLKDIEINEFNYRNYYEFYSQYENCKKCRSLADCKNENVGFKPIFNEKKTAYVMCDFYKKENKSNVLPMFMSNKILESNLSEFRLDSTARKKLFKWGCDFLENFHDNPKGIYLYGEFGVGKTYFLSALANELSKRNIKTILTFFPDLSRELKSSIGQNNLEYLVHQLKTVDCLMLDDFGGEQPSDWLRDEVITPILQYRLTEKLPTLITSNLDFKLLHEHLSNTKRDSDRLKAQRLIQRIKDLCVFVNLNKSEVKDEIN